MGADKDQEVPHHAGTERFHSPRQFDSCLLIWKWRWEFHNSICFWILSLEETRHPMVIVTRTFMPTILYMGTLRYVNWSAFIHYVHASNNRLSWWCFLHRSTGMNRYIPICDINDFREEQLPQHLLPVVTIITIMSSYYHYYYCSTAASRPISCCYHYYYYVIILTLLLLFHCITNICR